MTMADVIAILLKYEFGTGGISNPTDDVIDTAELLVAEATIRNLDQVCADDLGISSDDGDLVCTMAGINKFLIGIQGWYDREGERPVEILGLQNLDPDYTFYLQYAELISENRNWWNGNDTTRPFTWGNWTPEDPPSQPGYNLLIAKFIDGDVVIEEPEGDDDGIFYARRFGQNNPSICDYVYAITSEAGGDFLGQTGACSSD